LRVISLRHDAAVADNIPLEFCSRHDVDRLELKEGIEVEKPTYEACLISPSLMRMAAIPACRPRALNRAVG